MKTTIFQFSTKRLYTSFITAGLTGILSLQNIMAMPLVCGHDPVTTATTSPEKLRVLSYTIHNSLVIKLHMENPGHKKVRIQIMNSRITVLYEAYIGKQETFVGKYNLQELPDGNYTLVVQSPGQTYTKSFSLQTSTERVVKTQDKPIDTVTQDAI